MDYLESLGKQLSEITMYDVRSAYSNAKAMVLNLSEMEKLVSEATSNEAWGASSTLMQQIATGTHNYQNFNEIMPAIYRRFTDLDARQWRQVYKALTLLEYLIKNGSERVVDDARQHLSLIKILRNFHYIDEKGKDQGINVRNRSKELAELLQDLDKVRQERRKAKQNRNKYGGVSSEGSRYGGFGSESFSNGGGSGGGGSDGYGGNSSSSFRDTSSRNDDFDEYDAGDDEDRPTRQSSAASRTTASSSNKAVPPTPKKKEPEINLFDLDDEEQAPAPAAAAPAQASGASTGFGDDDFDDFQGAAPAAAQPVKSVVSPAASGAKPNFFDMMSPTSTSSAPAQPANHFGGFTAQQPSTPAAAPRYGMSSPPLSASSVAQPQIRYGGLGAAQPAASSPAAVKPAVAPPSNKPSSGGFDDLWDLAGGSTAAKAKPAGSTGGQSMATMAQQSLWNAPAKPAAQQQQQPKTGSSDFDLLM